MVNFLTSDRLKKTFGYFLYNKVKEYLAIGYPLPLDMPLIWK